MQGSFKGWMLASDIDGTLIRHDFFMPQENIDAVKRFRDGGGIFTLATGRSVESARPFVKKLGLTEPVIVLNGAAFYDYANECFTYECPMDNAEGLRLINAVYDKFPEIGIEIHSGGLLHVIRESGEVLKHIKNESLPAVYTKPESIFGEHWHKLFFAADECYVNELREFLKDYTFTNIYYVNTATVYVEVLANAATKGNALKEFAKLKGIDMSRVCAIGDYYNDRELINAAGVSCYTANAPKELKDTADYVACHVDDGAVADFINHIDTLAKQA